MVKVAVCGAAGGIGQPLSLLLKLNPLVSELSLYDIANSAGVAADLSHISTPAIVKGYAPASRDDLEALGSALTGCEVVIIPAGVPRKPGMTRDDLFKINAGIVRSLVAGVAKHCPRAVVCIISNPVNATVPIAAEELKKHGVFDPKKLFGVTTLDSVRAETFLAELIGAKDPEVLRGEVAIVGGHSGDTIVPLLSKSSKHASQIAKLPQETLKKYIHRVQFGGDEVVQAKNGAGSATLSMAHAGYRFAELIIQAKSGKSVTRSRSFTDAAYVYLPGIEGGKQVSQTYGVDYFALPVRLARDGSAESVDASVLKGVTSQERELLKIAAAGVGKSVVQGTNFVVGAKL
ncbi:hypothetical protein BABINDRAFT_178466 [Babjeviella inositovora NRRL Y-12698]|uniref:Malate dehydrogenase n=1 Tax=Babjeviella inositovora NRRL Y-12698 TaxID=984486 RepID=A0A1E3QJ94_9ASCO|nr:uncharacterized protein BABINDRAFT_178466 [Babjeviella inositovora NRRL Y-12698]ODQ77142.1 hypothetical protein BABINDRAFT_178466 [Babjeviella inositovora NRRL Y-12698]